MGETKPYTFFGFRTEVDEAATRRWYAQAEPWGCCCGPCRNFLALARERASAARRRLEELAGREQEESRRQGRVLQALGLSGGAFLVILLL